MSRKQITPVPWSEIKKTALAKAAEEFSEENGYGNNHPCGTNEFHVYAAAQGWHYWADDTFHIPCIEFETIPPDILAQVIGQKFGWDGIRIHWKGNEYVVAGTSGLIDPDKVEFEGGLKTEFDDTSLESAVGKRIVLLEPYSSGDASGHFKMVAASFIDFSL